MMKLHHAPRTRSVRIVWLLEELDLPYDIEEHEFAPAPSPFSQTTPTGKFPTLEDDGMVMSESGAIVEYILERYAEGRLQPPLGTAARGPFLQWIHYAEGTAHPPLGTILWHSIYRKDADEESPVIQAARERAHSTVAHIEQALTENDWVAGAEFTAADIMVTFTLLAARQVGILDERYPKIAQYLGRVMQRPAFQKAAIGSL